MRSKKALIVLEAMLFQYRKRYKGACNMEVNILSALRFSMFQYRKRYKGACNFEIKKMAAIVSVSIP